MTCSLGPPLSTYATGFMALAKTPALWLGAGEEKKFTQCASATISSRFRRSRVLCYCSRSNTRSRLNGKFAVTKHHADLAKRNSKVCGRSWSCLHARTSETLHDCLRLIGSVMAWRLVKLMAVCYRVNCFRRCSRCGKKKRNKSIMLLPCHCSERDTLLAG